MRNKGVKKKQQQKQVVSFSFSTHLFFNFWKITTIYLEEYLELHVLNQAFHQTVYSLVACGLLKNWCNGQVLGKYLAAKMQQFIFVKLKYLNKYLHQLLGVVPVLFQAMFFHSILSQMFSFVLFPYQQLSPILHHQGQ